VLHCHVQIQELGGSVYAFNLEFLYEFLNFSRHSQHSEEPGIVVVWLAMSLHIGKIMGLETDWHY
jgi:hypothetical protein